MGTVSYAYENSLGFVVVDLDSLYSSTKEGGYILDLQRCVSIFKLKSGLGYSYRASFWNLDKWKDFSCSNMVDSVTFLKKTYKKMQKDVLSDYVRYKSAFYEYESWGESIALNVKKLPFIRKEYEKLSRKVRVEIGKKYSGKISELENKLLFADLTSTERKKLSQKLEVLKSNLESEKREKLNELWEKLLRKHISFTKAKKAVSVIKKPFIIKMPDIVYFDLCVVKDMPLSQNIFENYWLKKIKDYISKLDIKFKNKIKSIIAESFKGDDVIVIDRKVVRYRSEGIQDITELLLKNLE